MTPSRRVSIAVLAFAALSVAGWPEVPSSRVATPRARGTAVAASGPVARRGRMRGGTAGCGMCHALETAAPAELACREPRARAHAFIIH